MDNETQNKIKTVPSKIKFDFDQAKTTTQQSLEMEDAVASGQEIDEESPTQHKFVRFRGDNWEDCIKVQLELVIPCILLRQLDIILAYLKT